MTRYMLASIVSFPFLRLYKSISPTPAYDIVSTESQILKMADIGLKYVAEIIECCHTLLLLPTLEPSEEVNRAFERLVSICSLILDENLINAVCTHQISSKQCWWEADPNTSRNHPHQASPPKAVLDGRMYPRTILGQRSNCIAWFTWGYINSLSSSWIHQY